MLKERYKKYTFELIVGSEIINEYLNWENGSQLKEDCKFIILERPDKKYDASNLPKNYRTLPISIDLGDEHIKSRIKDNTKKINFAINGLTSKSVIKYITENKLYQH